MAGFRPVGTRPVATVGATPTASQVFTPATGTFSFSGFAPIPVMSVPPVRVEMFWVEVSNSGVPSARMDWTALEVANDGAASARASWLAIEAVSDGAAYARVSSVFIEVLRSITQEASIRPAHLLMAAF